MRCNFGKTQLLLSTLTEGLEDLFGTVIRRKLDLVKLPSKDSCLYHRLVLGPFSGSELTQKPRTYKLIKVPRICDGRECPPLMRHLPHPSKAQAHLERRSRKNGRPKDSEVRGHATSKDDVAGSLMKPPQLSTQDWACRYFTMDGRRGHEVSSLFEGLFLVADVWARGSSFSIAVSSQKSCQLSNRSPPVYIRQVTQRPHKEKA